MSNREHKGTEGAPKGHRKGAEGSQEIAKGSQKVSKESQGATKIHSKIDFQKRSRKGCQKGLRGKRKLSNLGSQIPLKSGWNHIKKKQSQNRTKITREALENYLNLALQNYGFSYNLRKGNLLKRLAFL